MPHTQIGRFVTTLVLLIVVPACVDFSDYHLALEPVTSGGTSYASSSISGRSFVGVGGRTLAASGGVAGSWVKATQPVQPPAATGGLSAGGAPQGLGGILTGGYFNIPAGRTAVAGVPAALSQGGTTLAAGGKLNTSVYYGGVAGVTVRQIYGGAAGNSARPAGATNYTASGARSIYAGGSGGLPR